MKQQPIIAAALMLMTAACVNDNLVDLAASIKSDTTQTVAQTPSGNSTGGVTPPPTPTTTSVTFAINIKPILNKYQCASCHGSSYSSYAGASSLARSGWLYGTMAPLSGYRRMPPGQRVSAAELSLISDWIKAGEPQ